MSPLARSLLVFSCAALLRAVCATYPEYDPDQCTILTIGERSGQIIMERKWGPRLVSPDSEVEIPVLHRPGIEIVEETVIVCSDVGWPPKVLPPSEGFSPIAVLRPFKPYYIPEHLLMTVYQSYKVVAPEPTLDSDIV